MSKSLLFSDIHLHPHEIMSITINGRNSRLQDAIDVLHQMKAHCLANNIKRVYFLGDFFHTRTKIDVDLYNLAYEIIGEFFMAGIQFYLIAGNHDLYYKFNSDVTSLRPMSRFATVITEPTVLADGNCNMVMIPYYERVEDYKKAVSSIDYSKLLNMVFLTHAEFVGSYKAAVSKEVTKHGIDLSVFPAHYRYILMGHYHMPQRITEKVMYLGSPLQVSMREILEDKYFYEFDSDNFILTPIRTNSPRFSVVEYPSERVLKFCRKGASIEEAITGNYVEVIAYETIKKNTNFHKLLQTARNVIVNNKVDKGRKGNSNVDVDLATIDMDQLSEQYVNDHPHEYLTKEFLLSVRNQITKV